jgi:hypothetical protein
MRVGRRLLLMSLLWSVAAWAQTGASEAPKSRKPATAGVHKMAPHAARQLSMREKHERAQMRTEQRRQAKLAKRQRKDAMRRSRRTHKAALKNQ